MTNNFTDWNSELCHHGVKGQKWGVRKYQNEDGSLTAEGQKKYGNKKDYRFGAGLFELAQRTRLTDSDRFYGLGSRDLKEGRVSYYESKLDRYRIKSPSKRNRQIIQQTKAKLAAQKAANASRDSYDSRTSVPKLWVQNKILGQAKAERYRDARARGDGRTRSFVESILSGNAIGIAMRRHGSKRAYGANVKW